MEITLSTCLLFPNGRRFISRKPVGVAAGSWRQIPGSIAPVSRIKLTFDEIQVVIKAIGT